MFDSGRDVDSGGFVSDRWQQKDEDDTMWIMAYNKYRADKRAQEMRMTMACGTVGLAVFGVVMVVLLVYFGYI